MFVSYDYIANYYFGVSCGFLCTCLLSLLAFLVLSNVHFDQLKDLFHPWTLFIAKETVHYEECLEEWSQVNEKQICCECRCTLLKHSVSNEL